SNKTMTYSDQVERVRCMQIDQNKDYLERGSLALTLAIPVTLWLLRTSDPSEPIIDQTRPNRCNATLRHRTRGQSCPGCSPHKGALIQADEPLDGVQRRLQEATT